MLDYLLKRPMLFCGIFCSVIAVVGYYFGITLLLFGVIIAIAVCVLIFKNFNPVLIFSLILMLLMVLSSINAFGFAARAEKFVGKTLPCDFVVKESVNKGSYNKASIEITDSAKMLIGKTADVVYYNDILEVGKYYSGKIKFREIAEEYKLMNYSENIFLSGILKDTKPIPEREDHVLQSAEKIRGYIKETLFRHLGYNEASTLCAILFGDRSFFSNEFYNNVKGAGVSHVMVVSGMHLAVIVSFFTKFLDFFTYNRHIKAICIFAVVLFLTLICGFTVSMQRAGITYALFGFSLLLNRRNTPANSLGAAIVIILLFSPFTIFNVAFQLSVLSTFGILAVALPIMEYIKTNEIIKSSVLLFLLNLILLSLSAMLLTLPVTIHVFGYISTVSVLTNLLISNIVTLTLCVGVTAILASLVSTTLAAVVLMPCDGLLKYINSVINMFGGWEFSILPLASFWSFVIIFLIIFVFWLLLACKKRKDVLKLKKIRKKIIKEGGKIHGNSF